MEGRACPVCLRPALRFGRYWREVEAPRSLVRCSRCGSELAPHWTAWAARGSAVLIWMPLLGAVVLWGSRGGSAAIVVPTYMAGCAGMLFSGWFLAWLLPPWKEVTAAKKQAGHDFRNWIA
jgi:hypothetical protein